MFANNLTNMIIKDEQERSRRERREEEARLSRELDRIARENARLIEKLQREAEQDERRQAAYARANMYYSKR